MADQRTRPLTRLGSCAMCGHLLVDELPSSKNIACKDKQSLEKWQTDWMKVEVNIVTGLNPLLDAKGAIVTTLKNPIFGNEVLMCHCWQNFNSAIVAGTECVFSCYNSRSKTQYEAGKCPFVFAKFPLSAQKSEFFSFDLHLSFHGNLCSSCLLSSYTKKQQYFELEHMKSKEARIVADGSANNLLNNAARVRMAMAQELYKFYLKQEELKHICIQKMSASE